MTWTEYLIRVHVDGEPEHAQKAIADYLGHIIRDERTIAVGSELQETHRDECDAYPCTCEQDI